MIENSLEQRPNFYEFVDLNKLMSPEEAVAKLVEFGYPDKDEVLNRFINLRGFEEGRVVFKMTVNGGYDCVEMIGEDPKGNFMWNHLIDMYTGRPQSRVG